jgi:hypothetical protein
MNPPREDPAVTSARREAAVVAAIFTTAMCYTVLVSYWLGYHRAPGNLTYILGFPDWVFWGIVLPWIVCLGLSIWFGNAFVQDSDLGEAEEDCGPEWQEAEDD